MRELIVATKNRGKLHEIRQLLSGLDCAVTSLDEKIPDAPPIPETGITFVENAFLKAQWAFSRTGVWSLADDSGLVVDYLGGDPGVRSARYAGESATDEENNRKLLHNLSSCPATQRTARFVCVTVLMTSMQETVVTEGAVEGSIGFEPRGDKGFGYDPLFIPRGYDHSFAQLDNSTKNTISHRARALAEMRRRIQALL